MDLESAKKVPLNKITHSVRASQAVLQYGVGAMIDFPNQTLMTAAPEYWQEQVVQIHDHHKFTSANCKKRASADTQPGIDRGSSFVLRAFE